MSSIAEEPSTNYTSEVLVGWVPESPGRGTLGLIINCGFTIFICTWVVVHPRVHESKSLRTLHKAFLFIKGFLAPEFIAVESLQEWSQARKMVMNCTELTGGGLKLVHAFYIGMLALKYRTPQGERIIWPNQYVWLLQQRLVHWKDHAEWGLDENTIKDKSKADSAVKLLALCQVSWFVLQSIMRVTHKLPLSAIESMTIGYFPLFAATYFLWWLKPKDIYTASVINLPPMSPEQIATFESMAVSRNFDHEGVGGQDSLHTIWQLTPRVFEKEAEDRYLKELEQANFEREKGRRGTNDSLKSNESSETVNYETVNYFLDAALPRYETIVAHWDPDLYHSKRWPVICLFAISFPALHLIAWNTHFPTIIEQRIWCIAALVSIFSMLVFMHFERVVLRWGGILTIVSLVSPVLYLISRVVIIVGAVAALRASELAVYETFVVSNYFMHMF